MLAPGNIALVYLAGDVTLTWDAVVDAAGYAVYSSDDPYGTFVLFNTLEDIFSGKTVEETKETVFENYDYNEFEHKNYIFISNNFEPDKYDTETLLKLAERGSNIFVSAHMFSKEFSDTLNFEIDNSSFFDTSSVLNFYNMKIKQKKDYYYGRSSSNYYFGSIDTLKSLALGYSKEKRICFLRYKHGKGNIYILCLGRGE